MPHTLHTVHGSLDKLLFVPYQHRRAVVEDLTCDKYIFNADCTSKLWYSTVVFGGIQASVAQHRGTPAQWLGSCADCCQKGRSLRGRGVFTLSI